MQKENERQPYTIENLAEFKRLIVPGTELMATSHANHPEMVGLVRVVTEVQSNAFYSVIKDQPEHRWSTCNYGKGFRTDFGKARDYIFDGTTVKMLDTRKNDGSILCEYEVYAPPYLQTNEEPSRDEKNISAFLHILDAKVLPKIDYEKYRTSCQNHELDYPSEILRMFHEAFVQVYGDGVITEDDAEDILLPAVIQAHKTGDILIGLVQLDLWSSGEHWGTDFLTPVGLVDPREDSAGEMSQYLRNVVIPYDYYYTPEVEGDIHVDKYDAPDAIKTMLDIATGGEDTSMELEM